MTTGIDRPAAIRKALRDLVAQHGFHGASMSKVAAAAGVAVGTAYVHYESKEDLVHAAYLEAKRELACAAVKDLDAAEPPAERYRRMWLAAYAHFASSPEQARFLIQLEDSPFYAEAHLASSRRATNSWRRRVDLT